MTLLVRLLHRLHEFLLPHPETFLHTEDQQAHLLHVRYRRVPACPRGAAGERSRRHMVHWRREKGRSSAWARDSSRRDVEISLQGQGAQRQWGRIHPASSARAPANYCLLVSPIHALEASLSVCPYIRSRRQRLSCRWLCAHEIDLSSSVMARSFSRCVPCRMSSRLLYSFRSS